MEARRLKEEAEAEAKLKKEEEERIAVSFKNNFANKNEVAIKGAKQIY